MLLKGVKSQPLEDLESKRHDSARSQSKLRRASNPEGDNISELEEDIGEAGKLTSFNHLSE